jgi:FMN phosphatase YigB (HAD superfamily)
MKPMKPYRVIFLDWDLTLSSSRFWGHWRDSTDHEADYQRIQNLIFSANHPLLSDWMAGKLSAEAATEKIASICSINYHTLFQNLELSSRSMTIDDPKVLQIAHRLRSAGTKVVIATDNMDTFIRWTVPSLDLTRHFDAILSSHDLGTFKRTGLSTGESAFFNPYLHHVDVAPSSCLLIVDSLGNLTVERFGLDYIQVDDPSHVRNILEQVVKNVDHLASN